MREACQIKWVSKHVMNKLLRMYGHIRPFMATGKNKFASLLALDKELYKERGDKSRRHFELVDFLVTS